MFSDVYSFRGYKRRMMMKKEKVYIVLSDTSSIVSKLIKLYTKNRYNHVSISFDSQLLEVYSFGRKKVGNPFSGGFVREDMKRGLFKDADCVIYSLTVTERQLEKLKRYIFAMERSKEIYRYHFLGLFGFLVNKPIQRKNAYFCSQFVATILKKSQVIDFDKPLALIAPHDFQGLTQLDLVYEGKLNTYLQDDRGEISMTLPSVFV